LCRSRQCHAEDEARCDGAQYLHDELAVRVLVDSESSGSAAADRASQSFDGPRWPNTVFPV